MAHIVTQRHTCYCGARIEYAPRLGRQLIDTDQGQSPVVDLGTGVPGPLIGKELHDRIDGYPPTRERDQLSTHVLPHRQPGRTSTPPQDVGSGRGQVLDVDQRHTSTVLPGRSRTPAPPTTPSRPLSQLAMVTHAVQRLERRRAAGSLSA